MLINENPIPTMYDFETHVDNQLFQEFNEYIQDEYKVSPIFDYSKCSLQKGWNIKYKKRNKSLCTVYPDDKKFIVLVVISQKEKILVEKRMDEFSSYIQELVKTTKEGNGQKWLMIEVLDSEILNDVKKLVEIRVVII